ncbi:hypothetical protein ACFVFS_24075 [Kitasatospora sp. NPDC057692]
MPELPASKGMTLHAPAQIGPSQRPTIQAGLVLVPAAEPEVAR